MSAPTRRTMVPGALVALAALALGLVWLGARLAARHLLGPPGFTVERRDRDNRVVGVDHVPVLFTPEASLGPPIAGSVVARGSFVARSDGTYTWKLGGTSRVTLAVDGRVLFSPRPGLVYDQPQTLARGVHAVEVTLSGADDNGAVVLAFTAPGGAGYVLVGPDVIVDAPADAVAARFRSSRLAAFAPDRLATFVTLLVAALALAAAGRERRRRLPALLVALFGESRIGLVALLTVIAWPFLHHFFDPGYVFCHEGEGYTVRLVEYAIAIRDGVPMGRWWTDPVFGRGYPFLCLYAPLLYLVETPFILLGVPGLAIIKIVSALLVVAGIAGTYGVARRRASRPAALAAVVLFVYAPYLQTDLWIRADIPEALGFGCFPLTLYALDVALDGAGDRRGRDAALLALALAALGSCHNITAYFAVYFLVAWLATRAALGTVGKEGLRRAILGGALGLLMTVFYAVPAIGDAKRVWIERVTTGFYHSLSNLMSYREILTSQPRWGMRTHLGIAGSVAVAAALVAIVVALIRRRATTDGRARAARLQILALPAAVTTLLALALATRPVGWFVIKYIPLAGYVQFPWRMFLFAACTAPLCVPTVIDYVLPRLSLRWLFSAALALFAIVVIAPQYGPSAPLVRVHIHSPAYLRTLETDYVTSMNEYLPKTVKRTVPRFGDVAHVLTGSATLAAQSHAAGRYATLAEVRSPEAILEFNAHWFPGWEAFVDDKAASIGPGHATFDDGGLIRVRVPAGTHTVRLAFVRTTERAICDIVSLFALFVTLILLGADALTRRVYSPPRSAPP